MSSPGHIELILPFHGQMKKKKFANSGGKLMDGLKKKSLIQ